MTHKEAATAFLTMCSGGQVAEAYDRFLAPQFKHHNPFFAAGKDALRRGMEDAAKQHPHQVLYVKHVLEDGDIVAVHSHVIPEAGSSGIAVTHLLKFAGDRVVELWDVGQQLPPQSPNANGAF